MTVSIINIAPTEAIKPRLLVDFRGTLIDDADTWFSLRRVSDNMFWNFDDKLWNIVTETGKAIKIMISVGNGEYDSPAIPLTDLNINVGELLVVKFHATKDLVSDVTIDFYKVKLIGAPRLKFPQGQNDLD